MAVASQKACKTTSRLKPELKAALFTLLGIALVLVGLWVYAGISLGIWRYRDYDRYNWLTANLPVVRELWHGKIKAGDNVEKIVSHWHPHRIIRLGRWVRVDWYPGGPPKGYFQMIGICVIARDGVLVEGYSYSDDLVAAGTFFDTSTPQAKTEYRAALEAHIAEWHAKARRERELNGTNEESGAK